MQLNEEDIIKLFINNGKTVEFAQRQINVSKIFKTEIMINGKFYSIKEQNEN